MNKQVVGIFVNAGSYGESYQVRYIHDNVLCFQGNYEGCKAFIKRMGLVIPDKNYIPQLDDYNAFSRG